MNTLGDRVDFAQLIKVYRATPEGERRYSPAEVVSTEVVPVLGDPNPAKICTSHIERQNLTMRMHMRRLTRLTNGFQQKVEATTWAAICLHFAYYNFCRIHRTLRVTPAMQSESMIALGHQRIHWRRIGQRETILNIHRG